MHFSKKTLAVGLCATLGSTVCVVPAHAEVTIDGPTAIVDGIRDDQWDPYYNAELRADLPGQFTYYNPEAVVDAHTFELRSDITIDGAKAPRQVGVAPQDNSDGNADTVSFPGSAGDVSFVRSYRVTGKQVVHTVVARNDGDTAADIRVDMVNHLTNSPAELDVFHAGNRYMVGPKSRGYITRAEFVGADRTSVGATAAEALGGRQEATPTFQAGTWEQTLAPGEQLTAHAWVSVTTQDDVYDTDGDGLRDSWESHGMVLEDGTPLPIHKWGASQTDPDLYLQLNWMRSEWETRGCDRETPFEVSVEGFTQFAACARANTKDYAPSPQTLKDLEDLFAEHDVRLHIDAGYGYVSQDMATMGTPQGGKTLDFTPEFFPGYASELTPIQKSKNVADNLQPVADRLLGARKAAFRQGIIGDRISHHTDATGVAPINGSAFYVANMDQMTTQEQLRNTILHEFGHTLGLRHNGTVREGNTAPNIANISDYKSVMSYAHQWDEFNYSATDITSGNFTIPADWANLNYPGAHVGQGSISVGREDTSALPDTTDPNTDQVHAAPDEATADELILNSAADNRKQAGFTLLKTPNGDNGIVTNAAGNNVLKGRLTNLGDTSEAFRVTVDYGEGEDKGTYSEDVRLSGYKAGLYKRDLEIPIDQAHLLKNPVVPVTVAVSNSDGEQVFTETFRVSALNYSAAEMKKVLEQVLSSDADPQDKALAKQRLTPRAETSQPAKPVPSKPAPAPAPTQKKAEPSPSEKPSGSSDSPIAIIIGVLLGLIGLGAAGFGWAHSQGLLP
ncbi:hypothetical protein [Corynebacterium faecium]|uniref:hypothetical protein n=1 Tax=Corynebacterium faecium TaxID=3016001 RepID=UPI0022B3E0EB|nr:hypothetical protein [Corynebacterium faecium]